MYNPDKIHEEFMRVALHQAQLAFDEGEIPVGACIVRGGEIISLGRNTREGARSALGHAEINAIESACAALGSWRLDGCTLYVTLEPCPMCAGAIINARIERVVFGARDSKMGCFGSVCDLSAMQFSTVPYINSGILAEQSAELLDAFFKSLRAR